MRQMIPLAVVAVALSAIPHRAATPRRANFLHIAVIGPDSAALRAIWRPYAGAVASRGEDQQAALRARRAINDSDSLRRWRDPDARDTIRVRTPAEFLVDMTGGPVVVEALGSDSIRVRIQMTVRRGPILESWGRAFTIESDGNMPSLSRRQ